MAKSAPNVVENNDAVQRQKFPQSQGAGQLAKSGPVSMFQDDMSACKNRTNVGEGKSSKPSL